MENDKYDVRSLYEVIKKNLLLTNKDVKYYINALNDELVTEYQKIKKSPRLTLVEIGRQFENYYIFYLTVRRVLLEAKISTHQEYARPITDFFLEEELKFPEKKKFSNYNSDTE